MIAKHLRLTEELKMVNFKFVPLPDPRVTPEIKARFLTFGQLIEWELTDSSGMYTGLIFIGEKKIPAGFQTMMDIVMNRGVGKLSTAKGREIIQTVIGEVQQRGVMLNTTPAKA
jgi:hypothetical protein